MARFEECIWEPPPIQYGSIPHLLAGRDVYCQVIGYDPLESGQLFTHRVGRMGHMGCSEVAVTFITSDEARKRRVIVRFLGPRFASKSWRAANADRRCLAPGRQVL